MNKRIKIPLLMVMLFFITGLVAGLAGQAHRGGGHEKHGRMLFSENNLFDARYVLKYQEKINLSQEQQEHLENLVLKREAFYIRNSAEIKVKEIELASFLKSSKFKRSEVEKLVREISEFKTNLIIYYINYLMDVRELLNSKQLSVLKNINKKKEKE